MMKDEIHPSFEKTSMHARITCKCGKTVWYGCGNNQVRRPLYCQECTKKELARIRTVQNSWLGHLTDEEIIDSHLSRAL